MGRAAGGDPRASRGAPPASSSSSASRVGARGARGDRSAPRPLAARRHPSAGPGPPRRARPTSPTRATSSPSRRAVGPPSGAGVGDGGTGRAGPAAAAPLYMQPLPRASLGARPAGQVRPIRASRPALARLGADAAGTEARAPGPRDVSPGGHGGWGGAQEDGVGAGGEFDRPAGRPFPASRRSGGGRPGPSASLPRGWDRRGVSRRHGGPGRRPPRGSKPTRIKEQGRPRDDAAESCGRLRAGSAGGL